MTIQGSTCCEDCHKQFGHCSSCGPDPLDLNCCPDNIGGCCTVLSLPNLDSRVGLHTQLEVIYVVDGYLAELVDETEKVLMQGKGTTIAEALRQLEEKLAQ